jgi:hypothetical protein
MSTKWICKTCEERIEAEEIESHEAEGHDVHGFMVPDRLLANDPWQLSATGGQTTTDQ